MLATIDQIRKQATQELDQGKRSELGQFMTPISVAKFMSSLFQKADQPIRLLDAGAGVGSLTAAFLDRALKDWASTKKIDVTAYDVDANLLQYLQQNVGLYNDTLKNAGVSSTVTVANMDFIVDGVEKIQSGHPKVFTHAILNPPYKKIHSASKHRLLLRSIGFETVNLYSAFVALALMLLKDQGELVAIIPRSFCNGNYYKSFRKYITKTTAIKHMHLFDARDKAFKEDEVLQENIILHLVKGAVQENVTVSRSTDESLQDLMEYNYPFEQIVKPDDMEAFIHVPHTDTNHLEDSVLITYTLADIGLTVSTGPVVDFRAKPHLYQEPVKGSIPLLYPVHFNGKEIDWPKPSKKPNAISLNAETQKMLFPAGFYTVVRRFSSKEEKQRIVARVINPNMLDAALIGIENHLNVYHFKKSGIPENLAYGIAAYLNSSFVDTHFRSFNGHTQVNATDLRQMKYPSRDALMKLGTWAKGIKSFDQDIIDEQIEKIL